MACMSLQSTSSKWHPSNKNGLSSPLTPPLFPGNSRLDECLPLSLIDVESEVDLGGRPWPRTKDLRVVIPEHRSGADCLHFGPMMPCRNPVRNGSVVLFTNEYLWEAARHR